MSIRLNSDEQTLLLDLNLHLVVVELNCFFQRNNKLSHHHLITHYQPSLLIQEVVLN